MNKNTIGQILFWGALVVGWGLYTITAPNGMPWGGSTHAALAWIGTIPEMPQMTNAAWGYFVKVFYNSSIMLAGFSAAASAGLLASMVNRYFGWRAAAATAIFWIFSPIIWDRATIGARGVSVMLAIITAIWLVNVMVIKALTKTKLAAALNEEEVEAADSTPTDRRRKVINRFVANLVLCGSVLFAVVSATNHDYQLGEAASVYARGVLEEAGGKIIVLNGVADDQMFWENSRRGSFRMSQLIASSFEDKYRRDMVEWLRNRWPEEQNLIAAAQVGPIIFAEIAVKKHPERFYTMNGQSTTVEGWKKRWEAIKPFCGSKDPFISAGRAIFSYEGNVLAGKLQDAGKTAAAWEIYNMIYEEIDSGNISTLVNILSMINAGQKVPALTKQRIEARVNEFFRHYFTNGINREYIRLFVRQYGPVWVDAAEVEKLRADLRKKMEEQRAAEVAAMVKAGKTVATNEQAVASSDVKRPLPEWAKTLFEWNAEMLKAHDEGDITNSVKIARKILSNRDWRDFAPANVIMGVATSIEGDYVSSEIFFRTAIGNNPEPPAILCNDYGDTLMRLGRYDEAEKYLRLAIKDSQVSEWLPRYTLLQLLTRADKNPEEREELKKLLKRTLSAEGFKHAMDNINQ